MARADEEGRAGNYAYACARVRARKSSLLPREAYPRLLKMDLPQIGRFLGEGQYRREVEELAGKYSGVDLVEQATYLNLARTYRTILDFTRGELRDMVRHFLNRWDIWNFKTVLRGKTYGAPWKEVAHEIIPAGTFDLQFFARLHACAGPEEMLELLRHGAYAYGHAPALLGIVRRSGGGELPLARIENDLDREYYRQLLESVPDASPANRTFREYLEVEIDVVNMKTVFKLKFEDVGAGRGSELMVEGGRELRGPVLRRLLAAEGWEAFLAEIASTGFHETVREAASRARSAGTLHEVLLALDRCLLDRARRFSHLYPLSVLPVVDYLLRKKAEVDNLRMIARGKQLGLLEPELRSLLVA